MYRSCKPENGVQVATGAPKITNTRIPPSILLYISVAYNITDMFYYLYQVTNKLNSKIYIGIHQTNNIDDGYMGSGTYLKRAIKKYGEEHFEKTILESFDNLKDLLDREREIVNDRFLARPDVYNLVPGGRGPFVDLMSSDKAAAYRQQKVLAGKQIDILYGKEHRSQISKLGNTVKKTKKLGQYAAGYSSPFAVSPELQQMGRLLTLTPEAKAKRKETQVAIKHQQGEMNSQFGSRWITKDGKSIKVKHPALQQYLEDGWVVGRIIHNHASNNLT